MEMSTNRLASRKDSAELKTDSQSNTNKTLEKINRHIAMIN